MEKVYQRFGNVIVGWKTDTGIAFAGLLRHFIPPPATIIDLCAGDRRMYRKMEYNKTIDGNGYKFIFGDIREISGLDYVCDIRNPPAGLEGVANGFVYDPPWPTQSGNLGSMIAKYWPMKKEDFPRFLNDSFDTIDKVLKDKGILVIKISHPWNHIIYNSLTRRGYEWIRDIPQLSIFHGVYLITYFMIFKKQLGGVKARDKIP